MQVHRDDVGNGADEVLLHAVENEHRQVGAQSQYYLYHQEAYQRDLPAGENTWWCWYFTKLGQSSMYILNLSNK